MYKVHRLGLRQASDAPDWATSDGQGIFETGGEQHADPRPAALDEGIGRRSGAMGEDVGARQDIADRRVQRSGSAFKNIEHALFA